MSVENSILPPQIISSPEALYAIQGDIYKLEVGHGGVQKRYHTQGIASMTVKDDIMYVNTNNLSENMLQALHADDGTLLWSFRGDGRLMGPPTFKGDIVYISTAEGTVSALRAKDGFLLWQYKVSPFLFASPTEANGVVYVSSAVNYPEKPYVYALEAQTGSLLWRCEIPASTPFALVVQNGLIYISSYKECFALHASNGFLAWKYKTNGQICSSPVVVNGIVYISLIEAKQEISPFDFRRIRQWQEDSVCTLKANDGSLLWQHRLGNDKVVENVALPLTIQEIVFVGANDGYLYAFRADDGTLLWRYKTHGKRLSTPTTKDGMVYIGADDGGVYALQARTGSLLWQTPISIAVTVSSSIEIQLKRKYS